MILSGAGRLSHASATFAKIVELFACRDTLSVMALKLAISKVASFFWLRILKNRTYSTNGAGVPAVSLPNLLNLCIMDKVNSVV